MTTDSDGVRDGTIDWSLCSWEGARLAQLRAYRSLSLAEKLEAIEQMCEVIRTLRTSRERKGLAVENLGWQRRF